MRSFRSETIYHLGIGTLVVRMKKDPKMIHPRHSVEEDQIQYHLSLWFINRGITIATTREFGTLQATLRPYRLYHVALQSSEHVHQAMTTR